MARTARSRDPSGPCFSLGLHGVILRGTRRTTPSAAYCFGASAGGAGGVASAGAAGAAASAGAAGASAAGAGGVASVAAGGGVAAGFGAGGFLLRAGRQHQRRNECAKSKFSVHRSVPRREARVVRKPDERVFVVPRVPSTGRARKFYRVPTSFETAWRYVVSFVRQRGCNKMSQGCVQPRGVLHSFA